MRQRAHYLTPSAYYELDLACRPLAEGFGYGVYLVGSSMERPDYRDVDVRLILSDEEFDRIFLPGTDAAIQEGRLGAGRSFWTIVCLAVSRYLSERSGLPVDFQVQRQTEANQKHDGPRSALGTGRALYAGAGDGTPEVLP